MSDEREAPALIGIGAKTLVENADRLGLKWGMRPATVNSIIDANNVVATFDADTEPINMVSLLGPIPVGTRVRVIKVPPSGNFIVGIAEVVTPLRLTRVDYTILGVNTGLSTVAAALPSTLITVITFRPATCEAQCVFDFDETTIGTTVCVGRLQVDGVTEASTATLEVVAVTDRATVTQQWAGSFPAAGTHTFVLEILRTVGAGAQQANATNTTLLTKVYE